MSRLTIPTCLGALAFLMMAGCLSQPVDLHDPPFAREELDAPDRCLLQSLLNSLPVNNDEDVMLSLTDLSGGSLLVRHLGGEEDATIVWELTDAIPLRDRRKPITLAEVATRLGQHYSDLYFDVFGKRPDNLPVDSHAASIVAQPRFQLLFAVFCTPDSADSVQLIPILAKSLVDSSAETRAFAAIGLGKFGHDAHTALDEVRKTAADGNPVIRCYAAYALWQIGQNPQEAVAVLRMELASKFRGVPELAALLLGRMGPDAVAAVPSLCNLVDNKSPNVRAQALFALGSVGAGAASALPLLCAALKDPKNQEEVQFANYRCSRDENSAAKVETRSVRSYAAIAIGEIGRADPDVIAALKAFRKETWIGTTERRAADQSLQTLVK